MAAVPQEQQPTPERFFNTVNAYQQTEAMKAAIELEIFAAIAEGCTTAAAIASRCQAAERGVRILCDFLTINGFLEKADGRYRLTESTAVFLTSTSPANMGSVADFLAAPEMTTLWLADPAAFVRNGGSAGLANVAPENPVWVKFAKAMVPFADPVAQGLVAELTRSGKPPKRVLYQTAATLVSRNCPSHSAAAADERDCSALVPRLT